MLQDQNFFKYIIDKKNTYKDFIEFNKLYCAVSGSLIDQKSDPEFLYIKESKTKKKILLQTIIGVVFHVHVI